MTFTASLTPDGRITVALPPNAEIPPQLLSLMGEVAGDNPIAIAPCLAAVQVEAMAQRLAALLLRGA